MHFVLLSFEFLCSLGSCSVDQCRSGQCSYGKISQLCSLMLSISRDLELCCLGVNSYDCEVA